MNSGARRINLNEVMGVAEFLLQLRAIADTQWLHPRFKEIAVSVDGKALTVKVDVEV